MGARRRRPAARDDPLRQPPRQVRADERAAAVPRAGDGRRPRRWRAAGDRRRRRRVPARQLVLHPAVPRADDRARARTCWRWSSTSSPPASSPCSSTGWAAAACARSACRPRPRRWRPLAGALAGPGSVADMLGQLRATFGFRAAALLHHGSDGWTVLERSGPEPPARPDEADVSRDLGQGITLALAGGTLSAEDQRVLERLRRPGRRCCRARAAAARGRTGRGPRRGQHAARRRCCRPCPTTCARRWRRSRRRSPACASATSTGRRTTVAEFQQTIEEETDRLTGDRRQPARHEPAAGVGVARRAPADRCRGGRAAPRSPASGHRTRRVEVDVPETLPDVLADAGPARAGAGQPRRQRRCAMPRRTRRCGCRPARSPATAEPASTSG